MKCQTCGSAHIVKNGSNAVGTPKFMYRSCGRPLVEPPKKGPLPQETKELIDKLFIARADFTGGYCACNGCFRALVAGLCE
jgi:insertion element IS1 protein InsB